MDFFQSKNIEFYSFLNENFKINNARKWSDISEQITKAKISATFKFFSKLFPKNIDYSIHLQKEDNIFRSIHFNNLNPNKIINEIVRYSIYSEEIVVFHPLQNPAITNQKLNPIKNPKLWLQNFMDSLYFYIVLQKWVKAGIVKLIVNPSDYNIELQEKLNNQAGRRIETLLNNPDFEKISQEEASENMAEMLAESCKGFSIERIKEMLVKLENPRFKEEEAEEFSKKIFSKLNQCNPLYEKLTVTRSQGSILASKGGGNLESILYISNQINGNIYTTDKSNWFQINQMGKMDFWTKVAHLYSQIDLPFLNNVDTSFALNLRQDGRLSGVRNELRNIYSSLNSIDSKEIDNKKMVELNEGFLEAVRKADAEWEFIKKDAQNKRFYWATTSIGVPVVFNPVSIFPLLLVSGLWLGNNIRDEHLKLKKFRMTKPLSIYVDLKHDEPNFFSIIKNCIL